MSDDNNSIDKMLERFKTEEEVRAYSNAQFKTIQKLNKQLQELKKELAETKEKLSQVPKLETLQMSGGVPSGSPLNTSDEETICIFQLKFLRDLAMIRELTKEEAQKVEIFAKTLNMIRNIPKKVEVNTKDLSNEQLLSLIDDTITKPN